MENKAFKVGDRVKSNGTIKATGIIRDIVGGGQSIGFPWEDETPHYVFEDEVTGVTIISHPRSIELEKSNE